MCFVAKKMTYHYHWFYRSMVFYNYVALILCAWFMGEGSFICKFWHLSLVHCDVICDPLSQNEHKVAKQLLFKKNYRFNFLIIQTLKWYIICGHSSLFCPGKVDILFWFFFVFYCFLTCLTSYISVCQLATLRSFCGSRSHMWPREWDFATIDFIKTHFLTWGIYVCMINGSVFYMLTLVAIFSRQQCTMWPGKMTYHSN